jgi:hypothetical protein
MLYNIRNESIIIIIYISNIKHHNNNTLRRGEETDIETKMDKESIA